MFELTQTDILCIMVSLAMRYSISYKQDAEEIERVWRLEEAKSYSYRRVAKVGDSQKSVESKVFEDDGVGHVERRYRPWHIGLRAALREYFLFYGSFDIALLLLLMSALSHMDAFSVIYMVFVCVAVFNDERVVSTKIWNVLNFFLIVAIIIRYLAEIKFPMDSHLRRSWLEYLNELDSSVLPGLSFWLSLDQSSTSDKSWAFDFVTLVASILYSRAVKDFEAKRAKKLTSRSDFAPQISQLDDFTIQSKGVWDNIQLTITESISFVAIFVLLISSAFLSISGYFFFALSYITCASTLILSRNSIKQTLTLQRIRRFNISVLFAMVIYQIPYIRVSLDSIQYDKIHGRTPSTPYQCASAICRVSLRLVRSTQVRTCWISKLHGNILW